MPVELKPNRANLTVLIPITLSLMGGLFYLGMHINSARVDHLKEIIREYERSSQLDAPELVRSINQSAKALQLSSSERRAFDEAKNRVDEYAARIGRCEADLNKSKSSELELREKLAKTQTQCSETVRSLQAELASFIANETEIVAKIGTAAEVIHNHLMIGVQAIYDDRAVINLNSSTMFIRVGESTEIAIKERNCSLWLSKVDRSKNEATFRLICPTAVGPTT